MKTNSRIRIQAVAAAVVLVLGAGCSTLTPSAQTQERIAEKRDAYNKLTERQQENILGGAIERGNTTDMVYMALGKPDKVMTSADGEKAMWVYVEYYTPGSIVKTSLNNPNSSHYTPGVASASSAEVKGMDADKIPAWQKPMSFAGTTGAVPMQSLNLPDMRVNTVYVFYFRGKVVEIKLDGDSVDSAAADPRRGRKSDIPAPARAA